MVLLTSQETPGHRSGMARVVLRAAVDRAFRTRLLDEPHRAVAEVLGVEVPRTLRMKFIEKGSDLDLLVVLPDCVSDPAELVLDDLDAVLGGTRPALAEEVR